MIGYCIFMLAVICVLPLVLGLPAVYKHRKVLKYLETHRPTSDERPGCGRCNYFLCGGLHAVDDLCAKHDIVTSTRATCDLNTWDIFEWAAEKMEKEEREAARKKLLELSHYKPAKLSETGEDK